MKKTLIIVGGATAVGKTDWAIQLAKSLNTAIFYADSRQIYKELNIGTAKPSLEERADIPHYFLDHISIQDEYSVGKYEMECSQRLNEHFVNNDLAILTGGTGMYIKAIREGLDDLPANDEEIEETLNRLYKKGGLFALQDKLKDLDPDVFQQIDINNIRRIMRCLNVKLKTGKSILFFQKGNRSKRNYNIISINLVRPRKELYQRINKRVFEMMDGGLLDEVQELVPFKSKRALQTVGYSELFSYLTNDDNSLEQAVISIQQNSRRYAKRQLTWFRNEKVWKHFRPSDLSRAMDFIEDYINNDWQWQCIKLNVKDKIKSYKLIISMQNKIMAHASIEMNKKGNILKFTGDKTYLKWLEHEVELLPDI